MKPVGTHVGRHGNLIFSCLLFVLFEKIEILKEKTKPDILQQIAKSRNPDWILFDYARALGPVL
jgi:hypothetical protein